MTIRPQDITGLVLSGGRGSRMGGVDKGLQPFDGVPLALQAARRLQPQVGTVAINANRNLPVYQSFGMPVWPDGLADHAGPLAGFGVGLGHCETPYLLTVPCDTPLFPPDLALRLAQALDDRRVDSRDIAVAGAPEADRHGAASLRPQPVFCLVRVGLLESLERFMAEGGRKIAIWIAQHRAVVVPFDRPDDAPDAFRNVNTLAELQALANR